MNEIVSRMISSQALLFLYMVVGFIANRIRMIRDDNREVLVRLLMDIAMPMMVLNAFNKPTDADELRASLLVIAMSALGCVVTGLIGRWLWRREPENRQKVLRYASMFSNAGNAGLPVLNLVFGPEGVFYGIVYVATFNLFIWSWGLVQMRDSEGKIGPGAGKRTSWQDIRPMVLNPGTFGLALGLPLFLFSATLPPM